MAASLTSKYTNLTPDQSARILTDEICRENPFFFIRYGDGALECLAGRTGSTCDHEAYTPELGSALLSAWNSVVRGSNTYVGDWQSASFEAHDQYARYEEQYAKLIGDANPKFLHPEALLIMRESAELVDFYRAIKEDRRQKLYMGPAECNGAAKMLGAGHYIIPMRPDLHKHLTEEATYLLFDASFDILLYGAGMAGNVEAVKCWERFPERTYINIGSSLDILFRGQTRRQQLSPDRACLLFKDLL